MVLEATVICLDTSEFSRDGDFQPCRLKSQIDAGNMIAGAKSQDHPENSVGLISMAGESIDVLLTPSQDIGKILSAMATVRVIGGQDCDIVKAVQISQLALKHRQNKNQKQRIVCFVCSPVTASEKQLETLGKGLKKNGVSIDVVSLLNDDVKLRRLVEAADVGGTCHYVHADPVNSKHLTDAIVSSPIVRPDGAASSAEHPFGVDPDQDPELAMALRLSMEEASRAAPEGASNAPPEQPVVQANDEEMDDELKAALMASLGVEEDIDMEDPEIKAALQESMQDWKKDEKDEKNVFQDPAFIEDLMRSLPGVDRNDPRIQEALRLASKSPKNEGKNKKDEKDRI